MSTGLHRRRQPAPGHGRPGAGAVLAAALLAGSAVAAPGPAGDPGREAYRQCEGCHSLGRHRTGPAHCGVVGRRAGTAPGFEYSEALRAAGIMWTPDALDRFLAAPTEVVPGTSMTFAGVRSAAVRHAIVDYLARAAVTQPCLRPVEPTGAGRTTIDPGELP